MCSKAKRVGERIHLYNGLRGLDHCFVRNATRAAERPAAIISEDTTGRRVELYTDQAGIQAYTANWFHAGGGGGAPGRREGSGVERYSDYMGIALEPQNFPDAVHHEERPGWRPVILRPHQTYSNNHEFLLLLHWLDIRKSEKLYKSRLFGIA